MYICEECGTIFENYRRGFEEEKDACPFCGGRFTEAQRCDLCGEYAITQDGICDFCRDTIKTEARDFIKQLAADLKMPEALISDIVAEETER